MHLPERPGRVDKRRPDAGVDLRDLRVALEAGDEPPHGGPRRGRADVARGGADEDLRRGDCAGPDGPPQHVEAPDRLRGARDAERRARGDLDPERRQRHQDEHGGAGDEERDRPRHDQAGEPRPEAAVGRSAPTLEDAVPHGAAAAVVAEQHRLERDRAHDRDDRDQEARDAEHPDERERHRHEQREAERDGDPGEDDRSAGGLHRAYDRVVDLVAGGELLAEAVDDQERVVDRDPEADQLHEVRRVGRGGPDAGDAVDDPERPGDRAGGEDERDRDGPREPEDGEQHEEGDRDGDHQLAVLQVVLEDGIEVVLDRGGARDVDAVDARRVPERRSHRAGVALRPREGRAPTGHRRRRSWCRPACARR